MVSHTGTADDPPLEQRQPGHSRAALITVAQGKPSRIALLERGSVLTVCHGDGWGLWMRVGGPVEAAMAVGFARRAENTRGPSRPPRERWPVPAMSLAGKDTSVSDGSITHWSLADPASPTTTACPCALLLPLPCV